MRAELIPVEGGPPIPITKDITVVGRREYCDIQIDDPSLSKRHCVLVKTDGLLMIRDLATTNGTKVKGQMIRWAALLPNDRITLGKRKFRVYLGPDDSTDSPDAKVSQAKPKAGRSSKPNRPAPASTPRAPVAASPRSLGEDDRLPMNLDDPGWFDRLDMDSRVEEIIDLD